MKRTIATIAYVLACGICSSSHAATIAPSIEALSPDARAAVIVILRDQLETTPSQRGWHAARGAAITGAQTPMMSRLQQLRAQKVHRFRLINAVAATVSKEQAAELAGDPSVQAVVPDVVMRRPNRATAHSTAQTAAGNSNAVCNTLEPEALQLMNVAYTDPSVPQAQTVVDGKGKPVIGTGVKVAYIADGLDPNIKGFVRPDGSRVFVDYKDFSGDPADAPTGGSEAYGDASSIAAQDMPGGKTLEFDISVDSPPGHIPSPCNIRIRGVAPGASLVGLKVYSQTGWANASSFIEAIEYAVLDADVDVINESFSGNPYPDNSNDPVTLASAWAVRAGVTVVTSTGDGGPDSIGAPSTNPEILAVGATTQFRSYAQVAGLGVIALPNTGYLSNNISSLSAGGFSQRSARTVDVVAPGDLGWALCSTNVSTFQGCTDFAGNPSPFQLFGGTSESAPLTSATAALVIQAYRSTHQGTDPSPAMVKRIIMSTATDLGAPASEQGAGLVNALAAIHAALSVTDENGTPGRRGKSLLNMPTSVAIVDDPNSEHTARITLTNAGETAQHLVPHLQTLGKPFAGASVVVQLHPGADPGVGTRTFRVPEGAQHLNAAIAYQNDPTSIAYVDLTLIDPKGRIAAYSLPNGLGNGYGHADVVSPAAGNWTAIISTPASGQGAPVDYTGPVHFTWSVESYVDFGTISPRSADLAPGSQQSFEFHFRMASRPGDVAASIRFDRAADGTMRSSIPVSLRSLIPVDAGGGTFNGVLTGGNGRAYANPSQTFEFDVPTGAKQLGLTVDVRDSAYALEGVLIDPQGLGVSVQPNLDPVGFDPQYGLQLQRRAPQPGRWRFVLVQNYNSSGNQTALPFNAQVSFSPARVSATGLPNSASSEISRRASLSVPVRISNTGPVTLGYFVDARLDQLAVQSLLTQPGCPVPTQCVIFTVPPASSAVAFVSKSRSDHPITMDANPITGYPALFTGSPDIIARNIGPNTLAAVMIASEVPYGPWAAFPGFAAPFGKAGAPEDPIDTSAYVLFQPFDASVTSEHGNRWADLVLGTSTYSPLLLAPGQSGVIHVSIAPSRAAAGNTISGFIYVHTYNAAAATGDEVVRLPYKYTVTP